MTTQRLYRPVGLKEMELMAELHYKAFPPRLDWQPIFNPVLNQSYAEQIALQWNVPDPFSGHCGLVTAMEVEQEYIKQFEIQNVGGSLHDELWVPAEELEQFNKHIVGQIELVTAYLGEAYQPSENTELNNRIQAVVKEYET